MSGFYKTSYANYNNFLGPDYDQKRTASSTNNYMGRNQRHIAATKLRDSPYFSKDAHKKYTNQAGFNLQQQNKPILSGFKKVQNKYVRQSQPTGFQQTSTNGFKLSGMNKKDRFYETVAEGFVINQRPVSKQQSRNNKPKDTQESLEASFYVESDKEDVDEQDKFMLKDIENDSLFFSTCSQRPQTSKGFRKKSNTSDVYLKEEEDLSQLIQSCDFPVKRNIQQQRVEISIPIKSMYAKQSHPISAHQQSIRKSNNKPIDDLIRFNMSSVKKFNSNNNQSKIPQMHLPFETSIGSDFLSLFANSSPNLE